MSSQFGWVDFAEEDRQRMLNVVQLFREQDTRDELGIGTIRDAFADYFFPGTSTIQTRVRYMLFIPWIYQELEKKQVGSDKIAKRARDAEIKLIDALLDAEGKNRGVIGQDAKARLKRLPSSVYWFGLEAWGIRLFPGSQDQYHRYVNGYYVRRQRRPSREETDSELASGLTSENWDPGLPAPPEDYPQKCSFTLTPDEARYLQERIYLHHPDSLLARFVMETHWVDADIFWEHPVMNQVPPALQDAIYHARNFSETMHGAVLLYNLLLARKGERRDRIDTYQVKFSEWTAQVADRWADLSTWHNNLPAFWRSPALNLARIPYLTRTFVEAWLRLVFQSTRLEQLIDNRQAEQLIYSREVQLKRSQARLENPRALERWSGASGSRPLEYRWSTAASFVRDILTGLNS